MQKTILSKTRGLLVICQTLGKRDVDGTMSRVARDSEDFTIIW